MHPKTSRMASCSSMKRNEDMRSCVPSRMRLDAPPSRSTRETTDVRSSCQESSAARLLPSGQLNQGWIWYDTHTSYGAREQGGNHQLYVALVQSAGGGFLRVDALSH